MIWIWWLVFIVVDAIVNLGLLRINKVNHSINTLYRLGVWGVIWLAYHPIGYLRLLFWGTGAFFTFWLFFNPILNYMIPKPLDFLGKTAWLDRFEAQAQTPIIFFKIVLAIASIVAFYHTDWL